MATKQDLIADMRSLYPGAGVITKAEVKRYIRDLQHRSNEDQASLNNFFDGLAFVQIGARTKYLVIDVADKLYRMQAGA